VSIGPGLGRRPAVTTISQSTVFLTVRSATRHIPTVARLLFGLAWLVFGLNHFVPFLPPPDAAAVPPDALSFFGALMETGYMLPLIKGTEVVVGLALVTNRFVPLALVVIAPVLVNIVLVNAFLVPAGLGIALIFVAFAVYLAWVHREAYRGLLAFRTAR
jgi:hypothetical protein